MKHSFKGSRIKGLVPARGELLNGDWTVSMSTLPMGSNQ